MDDFKSYVNEIKKSVPNLIIGGDYNICHQAIDIHDPVRNAKVSGFLPEERAWLDAFMKDGMVDTFRMFNPDPHHYSRSEERRVGKECREPCSLVKCQKQ